MIARNSAAPSGAIIIEVGLACPSGYTRFATIDGKFLVGSATYNAAAGGASTHTHNVPAHTHTLSNATTATASTPRDNPVAGTVGNNHTHGDGGGTSGSGGSGTTDAQSNTHPYATVLLCQKD